MDQYNHGAPEVVTHSTLEVAPSVADADKDHYAIIDNQQQQPYYQGHDLAYGAPQWTNPNNGGKPPNRRILGLRVSTFWLVMVLLIVIIAAAIGGGVGASQAVASAREQAAASASARATSSAEGAAQSTTSQSSSDSPTPTPSESSRSSTAAASSTAAVSTGDLFTAPTDVMLPLDCSDSDNSKTVTYNGGNTASFSLKCNLDTAYGDMAIFLSYSLSDCLTACATYNWYHANKDCIGVVYNSNMTDARLANDGNCWLKSTLSSGFDRTNYVIGVMDSMSS